MTFDPAVMADVMADTNVRNHEAGHHDLPRRNCKLCEPVRFFFDNGGFSYNPETETEEEGKLRSARDLAAAEAWAKTNYLTFDWNLDPEPDLSACDCGEDHGPVYTVVLFDPAGVVLGSLGGITFGEGGLWGDPYRRVVEAEVAYEAMEEAKNPPEPTPAPLSRAAVMTIIEAAYRDGYTDGVNDRDPDFDADHWAGLVAEAEVKV